MRAWWRPTALACFLLLAAGAMFGPVKSETAVEPPTVSAATHQIQSPTPTPEPTPTATPTPDPAEAVEEPQVGFSLGDLQFFAAYWADVFETLTEGERTCITDEIGATRLSTLLRQPLLEFLTPLAPWHVSFFGCLDEDTALGLLIYWLDEGESERLTANSLSCAREFLAPGDIATYVAGIIPDASSESEAASRQVLRGLLDCNVRTFRDSVRGWIVGHSTDVSLCLHSRVNEAVIASLLERPTPAGAEPWQQQLLRCLDNSTLVDLLFGVLATESGEVLPDQQDCVRGEFQYRLAETFAVRLSRSDAERAAAGQSLVDGLRSCIPNLILSGDDAHPVDRRVRLFSSTDSSCVQIEIGEAFLDLVLGKPYRPEPESDRTAQGCLVKPAMTAGFLALLSRRVDGITGKQGACVRSYLADAEFDVALLVDQSPTELPAFRTFAAGYRACIADLLASAGDGDGLSRLDPAPSWRFSTGGPIVTAPLVSDGVVYVGSDDTEVYALDAGAGDLLWSFGTDGAVRSSPTVAAGVLYVGSDDHHLYALDAGTGELRWKFDTGDPVQYQPTVNEGIVYVNARDGDGHKLHALDAVSGERIWVADVPVAFTRESAPTVAGSQVYAASLSGDLYALNALTGEVVWTFDPSTDPTAPPTVAGGRVYLTAAGSEIHALDEASGRRIWADDYYLSPDGNDPDLPAVVVDGVVYFATSGGIYGRNATTGKTVWVFNADGAIDSPPAIAQGVVYVGSDGGQFYATDPFGASRTPEELIWGFDFGSRTLRHPLVANGILYARSSDGKLEALNAANGHLLWMLDIGRLPDRRSYTAVENTIYVGSADGSLYAVITETPEVVDVTPDPVAEATPTPTASAAAAEIPAFLRDRPIQTYSIGSDDDGAEIRAGSSDSDLKLLTRWESLNNFLEWGPEGSETVLFVNGSEVYEVSADGSSLSLVVDAGDAMREIAGKEYQDWAFHAAAISPDGARVAYSTFEHFENVREGDLPSAFAYEIGVLQLDGSGRQPLTANGDYDDFPAWSPDGSRMAFVQWGFDSGYRIAVVDVDSASETVVASSALLPRELSARQIPAWSPDGERIAFAGFDRSEVRGPAIYTVGVDGSDLRLLTATNSRPAWSPDGRRIAFARPDGGELALFTIAADGSDLRRLTSIELSDGRASYFSINVERDELGSAGYRTGSAWFKPDYASMDPNDVWVDIMAWSPDGSMIMHGCGALVCVTTTDGAHVGTSPIALEHGLLAAWSPDGSRIAVGKGRLRRPAYDDGIALYTMAPDGDDVRLLLRHDSEGDLARLGVRPPPPERASTAGCAAGTAVANPAANPGLVRDCETLLELRHALGASPPLDWADDRPITEWEGVAVDGTPPRVTGLDLSYRGLSGVIPTELAELAKLRALDLSWNKLSGDIPPELGTLTNLLTINFFANYLTGAIPPELGSLTQLTGLTLSNNFIQGPIPPALGNLRQLEGLGLGDSLLTGPIPLELMQLSRLQGLGLGSARLTGAIPAEIGNLTSLTALSLDGNRLSGEIPRELGRLTGVYFLRLNGNQLSGEIPAELGALTQMRDLYLHDNQLSGPIPASFGQFQFLRYLHLQNNHLTGPIPAELGNLRELAELYLYSNELDGPIPAEIGRLSNLRYLYAWNNQITGPIPSEIGGLTSLYEMRLEDNRIGGSLPPEIGQLSNLTTLRLDNNRLTGEIPPEIGQLEYAGRVHLQHNQLSGSIPLEISYLSRASELFLNDNLLSGEIPPELGQMFELEDLRLGGNQLSGSIPAELSHSARLKRLDLSDNQLTGAIPRELYELWDGLNLANNRLTGSIPGDLGWHFRMAELDLSDNLLTGPIPADLGENSFLRILFLDGNQFSGEIPKQLGDLFRLEEINLAGNQLSGCVPSALRFAVFHEFEALGLPYCEN